MGHSVIKHLNEVGNERKVFFTESEIRLVIAGLPAYLKDFVLFAYITGMRKGEVQSLRWTDVHTDAITLRPENSKNVEARMIPLEGELAELIERCQIGRHFEKNGAVIISEYVFHDGGRPVGEFRKAGATAWLHAGFGRLVCPSCEGPVDAEYECQKCNQKLDREELRYRGRVMSCFVKSRKTKKMRMKGRTTRKKMRMKKREMGIR